MTNIEAFTIEDWIESLHYKSTDGRYMFTGDMEDVRLIMMELFAYKNERAGQVIPINNEWVRVDLFRKFNQTDDWFMDEYCILEGDEMYQETLGGTILNFSHDRICFYRINNTKDIDNTLIIPKEFEHESLLEYCNDEQDKNETLLNFAWLYSSEFMEQDEITKRFMSNAYGDNWREYSIDDFYSDAMDRALEDGIQEE